MIRGIVSWFHIGGASFWENSICKPGTYKEAMTLIASGQLGSAPAGKAYSDAADPLGPLVFLT